MLPPNFRDVTAENAGTIFAFVGAQSMAKGVAAANAKHAGTFADTVTGSTGAEVIALGTVIGIIGATAAKATKPG